MSEEKGFFEMSSKQSLVMGLAIGIAIISIIGFFSLLAKGQPITDESGVLGAKIDANTNINAAPAPTPTPAPADLDTADVSKLAGVLKDARSQGPDNAKVTLIEVSDIQCSFCSRHKTTMDQIMKDYSGKVRRVLIHFPLTSIHPQAQKAAEASECAGDQGKFWEMIDKLFANQSALSIENLKSYARDLGLNTSQFNSCLDDGKYASKVQQHSQAAQAAGITGTPGTFVNGELIRGAYPYETFKEIIDYYLEN